MTSARPKIRAKEADLTAKWVGVRDNTPVHQTQFAFETEAREKAFLDAQFPTPDERARYKAYRSEWHRRAKECDPGDAPLAVCCETVSSCDLSCSMCYTVTEDFGRAIHGARRMMPWPMVTAVIDEAAALGVASMLFSWRGEPTLYRHRDGDRVHTIADAVAYARQAGILEITFITHGQRIDREMAEDLVAAEPSWISLSVDGFAEAYNRIRTPRIKPSDDYNAFETVVNNIRVLAEVRDRAGKSRPQIRTNTIYPAIVEDPQRYYRLLAGAGVDMVTVNELLDLRAGDLDPDCINDDWSCPYPFQRMTVTADGVILPCTGAYLEQSGLMLGRYPESEASGGVADELPRMTLHEAWHSPKLQEIRRLHETGRRQEIHPGCRDCNHGAKKHGATRIPEDWNAETMEWRNRQRKG